jgi:hypothetical protein
MEHENTNDEIIPLVRKLYPNGTESELREAQQAFSDYVAVVLRIFDRLEREKQQGDSSKSEEHDRV